MRRVSGKAWCSTSCQKAYWEKNRRSYPKKGDRHAHRIAGAEIAGRPLKPSEVVHHKNEDINDFSNRNLEIMTRVEHSRLHGRELAERRKRNTKGQFA